MSASFCPDGKHIISASEDSQVYIWKLEESKSQGAAKKKMVVEVNAHENFACKDVSVAVTWPGSTRYEAPSVDLHPKKTASTKRPPAAPTQDEDASGRGTTLPPLPKKKKEAEEKKSEDQAEPAQEETSEAGAEASSSAAAVEGEAQAQPETSSSGTVQATAWGLVIVTATLEGEIKVYQNFGLPVKASRQLLF